MATPSTNQPNAASVGFRTLGGVLPSWARRLVDEGDLAVPVPTWAELRAGLPRRARWWIEAASSVVPLIVFALFGVNPFIEWAAGLVGGPRVVVPTWALITVGAASAPLGVLELAVLAVDRHRRGATFAVCATQEVIADTLDGCHQSLTGDRPAQGGGGHGRV